MKQRKTWSMLFVNIPSLKCSLRTVISSGLQMVFFFSCRSLPFLSSCSVTLQRVRYYLPEHSGMQHKARSRFTLNSCTFFTALWISISSEALNGSVTSVIFKGRRTCFWQKRNQMLSCGQPSWGEMQLSFSLPPSCPQSISQPHLRVTAERWNEGVWSIA